MATYFGEVVELSSRAVSDEDDGEESKFLTVALDFVQPDWDVSLKESAGDETIIFSVGNTASTFCKSFLLTDGFHKVAEVKARFQGDTKPEYLGQLYRSKIHQCLTICELREDISEEYYFSLSQTLCELSFSVSKGLNNFVHCIILTSLHSSAYKHSSERSIEEPYLRCLATKKYVERFPLLNVDYLFPPNIVSGLPAALMSFCEVRQKNAILYVCYSDSFHSSAVKSFENVLNNPLISRVVQASEGTAEKLEKLFDLQRQTVSNMYT